MARFVSIAHPSAMARHFFHVVSDTSDLRDEEGTDLDGLVEACAHARKIIGQMLADEIKTARHPVHLTVLIDDSRGVRVANINSVMHIVEAINPFADS
jgi:hypothetical protein